MEPLVPNFSAERARHLVFFERKDLFAHIDHLLCEGTPWVVIAGAPGSGKTAALANYLLRLETAQMGGHLGWVKSWVSRGSTKRSPLGDLVSHLVTVKADHSRRLVPQHFIRFGYRDWAVPLAIEESLLRQIEGIFPKLADPNDHSPRRVANLLSRVSSDELAPHHRRLIVVVDGLEQIEGDYTASPLFGILPPNLPDGVSVLCSTRHTRSGLTPLDHSSRIIIDLDSAEWAESNETVRQACVRAHVDRIGSMPDYVDAVTARADGNLRYVVDSLALLADNPRAPLDRPPPDFADYLDELLRFVTRFQDRRSDVVRAGLSALAASSDWQSPSGLASHANWQQPNDLDVFLEAALPVLVTEPEQTDYRLFHPSFGEHVSRAALVTGVVGAIRAMTGIDLPSPPPASDKPITNRYALVIGVDQYIENSLALRYCVNDAQAMHDRLVAARYATVSMSDRCAQPEQRPTLFNIRAGLAKLKGRFQPEELVLVYFAGHGMLVDGKAYLMASDSRSADPAGTALPLADVQTFMRASGSQRMILIVDACHAGVDVGRDGKPATNGIDPSFFHNAYALADGFAILAGSTAAQCAQDYAAKQHGVFTYFLLEALSGSADRGNKGFVTVDDLKTYVLNGVRTWCFENMTDLQLPTARIEGAGDMIVAYTKPLPVQ